MSRGSSFSVLAVLLIATSQQRGAQGGQAPLGVAGGHPAGHFRNRSSGVVSVWGYPGRMGNWMFRVAAAAAIAWDNDRGLVLQEVLPCLVQEDDGPEPPPCTFRGSFLWQVERVERLEDLQFHVVIKEQSFSFERAVAEQAAAYSADTNILLFGFFQSHRYFGHYRSRLTSLFSLPPESEWDAQSRRSFLLDRVEEGVETVSVHVRRTDYAKYPGKHDFLDAEYYLQAAEIIGRGSDRVYLIFADDPAWCREQEWLRTLAERVVFVELGPPDFIDLRVMSLCKHHIIANSSFSWWAAYLSARGLVATDEGDGALDGDGQAVKGLVVCPSKWFGRLGPQVAIDDLFPTDWIVV